MTQFRDLLPWQGSAKCQDQAIAAGWPMKAFSQHESQRHESFDRRDRGHTSKVPRAPMVLCVSLASWSQGANR